MWVVLCSRPETKHVYRYSTDIPLAMPAYTIISRNVTALDVPLVDMWQGKYCNTTTGTV